MSRILGLVGLLWVWWSGTLLGQVPQIDPASTLSQEVAVALLGASTRAPTRDEARTHELPLAVRTQGQVVTKIAPGGPAAKAGIGAGDVILGLAANTLFSRDDVEDFLKVTKPGRKIVAEVVRGGTSEKETVTIKLGTRKVKRPRGLTWNHAGLAQLETVLKLARDDRKRILVGLSGAET